MGATATPFDHRTDPRSPAAHEAAAAAVVESERAATQANELVSNLREALELGRATRGDLVKGQRRLAAAIEDLEQRRAAVRALARQRDELAATERAEREIRRAERARELATKRELLRLAMLETIDTATKRLAAYDDAIAWWNTEAAPIHSSSGGPQPGRIDRPSDVGAAWNRIVDGLAVLRRSYERGSR